MSNTNGDTWTDNETHYRWESVEFNYEAGLALTKALERYRKAEQAMAAASHEFYAAGEALRPYEIQPGELTPEFLTRLFLKIERRESPKALDGGLTAVKVE